MHIFVPRIFIPSYPGYSSPRTPDILTLVPRIFISSYPVYSSLRTPYIHPFVPRIPIPSYPGYSSLRTPDIHPFVPRIPIPSYPGYSSLRTPDIQPARTSFLSRAWADLIALLKLSSAGFLTAQLFKTHRSAVSLSSIKNPIIMIFKKGGRGAEVVTT